MGGRDGGGCGGGGGAAKRKREASLDEHCCCDICHEVGAFAGGEQHRGVVLVGAERAASQQGAGVAGSARRVGREPCKRCAWHGRASVGAAAA